MAIGIDTSNRKPRRAFGTPLYLFRDRIAFGILGVGCLIGSYCIFWPGIKLRDVLTKYFEECTEAKKYNQPYMTFTLTRSPADIKQEAYDDFMRQPD